MKSVEINWNELPIVVETYVRNVKNNARRLNRK